MGVPDDVLMRAADSIATGDEVDWNHLQQQPLDEHKSRVVGEMQVLERIAALLRDTVEFPEGAQARPRAGGRRRAGHGYRCR